MKMPCWYFGLFATVVSCSSIQSTTDPPAGTKGMYYFMPKKDFVVTVTVKGTEKKAAITESEAYPDFTKQYVLSYSRNLIGKNTLNLTVDEKGLLKTATSDVAAGISDALKNLASSVGTFSAMRAQAELAPGATGPAPPTPKCSDGDYTFIASPDPSSKTYPGPCGFSITVARYEPRVLSSSSSAALPSDFSDGSAAGVFYKQAEPYKVTATDGTAFFEAILFSPSHAPVRFLPASRSLFANNHTEFSFVDGMTTGYKVDADGEVVALLKLPADVISAYFGAIGAVFDAFKSNESKQVDAINAETKLQIAQQKYLACLTAIRAKDSDTITKLGC